MSSLILSDIDGDGKNEMIVGSDDYEIRVFKGEEVINECSETDKVTALCRYASIKSTYILISKKIGFWGMRDLDMAWRMEQLEFITNIIARGG